MTPPPARRPGPDSTLDDVRARLVDAGAKLLRERGAELGLANITLSDTIAEAGVSRSTSYRSLAHQDLAPQAVLHQEILTQLLTRNSRNTNAEAIQAAIVNELKRHDLALRGGSCQDRTNALRSIIRVGANTSFAHVVESTERSLLTAVCGSLRSSPAPPDWRHVALREGEHNITELFSNLYGRLAEVFDYGMRAPFTMNQLSAAGASLVEGISMRHGFNQHVAMIDRPTGPGDTIEEWSLFAVSFESLFRGMCQPRNTESPFANLDRY
jgi:AcrR family transcriptional regulator